VIRDWAEYDRIGAAQDALLDWYHYAKNVTAELLDRVYNKSLELSARMGAFLDSQGLRTRAESWDEYNKRGVVL
jgi:hypothetical protein